MKNVQYVLKKEIQMARKGYVNESGEFVRGSSKNLISSSEFIGVLSNSPANHSISQLCADIAAKGTVYFNDKLTYNSNFHLDLEKIDAAKKTFARSLPIDETILMYIDDTLFGVGDDGLIVTNEKIYFIASKYRTWDDDDKPMKLNLHDVNSLYFTDGKDEGVFGVKGLLINGNKFTITQLNDENTNHVIDILQNIINIYNR